MAKQGDGKGRMPRSIGLERGGWAGLDRPARLGRARPSIARDMHHEKRDARPLRGKQQLATCGKVQRSWRSPDFYQHRAERRTGESLDPGAQHTGRISGADEDQAVRIKPKFEEARRMERAHLGIEAVLSYPDNRPIA